MAGFGTGAGLGVGKVAGEGVGIILAGVSVLVGIATVRSCGAGVGIVCAVCVLEGSAATTEANKAPPPSIPATLSKLLISNKSTLDSVLRQAAHTYHAIIDLYG